MKLRLSILCMGFLMVFSGIKMLHAQAPKAYLYLFLEEKCPICQYYTLDLKAMYEKYQPEGVEIVGIFPFLDASEEGIAAFRDKYEIPFPMKVDEGQQIARLYQVKITPEVVLTDAQGEIQYRGRIDNAFDRPGRRRRVVSKHELTDALDALVSGKEIAISETQAVGCFITFSKKNP